MGIFVSRPPAPHPYFLSEYHCDLLKKSWIDCENYGPEKIGATMFEALFLIYPESFGMFLSFCDDPNWKTSAHYKHHCRVVVAVIGSGIKTLKMPEVLCPHLEFLGFQHKLRDIHLVHFNCLGEEMIKALEGALKPLGKDKWNDDIKAAWSEYYEKMSVIMRKPLFTASHKERSCKDELIAESQPARKAHPTTWVQRLIMMNPMKLISTPLNDTVQFGVPAALVCATVSYAVVTYLKHHQRSTVL